MGLMADEAVSFITYAVDEGIARLTLDRPPVNVLHIPMLQQLKNVLDELAQNTAVRVLILRAEGKMFSAGVDVADHTADKVNAMIPLFNQVCRSLIEFPVPTLAAVHGHALGGGCELVLCCDLAVIVEGKKIGQPEIQLAVFAPVAALRLPYLIGYRAAADLLYTGRNLTADEALRLGLVNDVVAPDQLTARVEEKAAYLANLSRAALVLNKRALHMGFKGWSDSLPDMEQLYLHDLMATDDASEGVDAFIEKRAPVWSHQ